MRVVGSQDAPMRSESENDLVLRSLVTARATADALSATWVRIDGSHRRLRNRRTSRIYYLISGSLHFDVSEAGSTYRVALVAGEVLILEPGTEYSLTGAAEYLVLNAPAFREGDDEYV